MHIAVFHEMTLADDSRELTANGIHVSYGSTVALRNVSLMIRPGEVVALVGPSGSGKSTLMYCLAGLMTPERGSVSLGGIRISELSDEARSAVRRDKFGFVFQFAELVPELTLVENVQLRCEIRGESRGSARRQSMSVLSRLGIAKLADRRPANVSGGERQRAAVARAIVGGPEVIFADEPTGSPDSKNGEIVLGELLEHGSAMGSTILLVTHNDQVASRCSRRLRLHDGELTADDVPFP